MAVKSGESLHVFDTDYGVLLQAGEATLVVTDEELKSNNSLQELIAQKLESTGRVGIDLSGLRRFFTFGSGQNSNQNQFQLDLAIVSQLSDLIGLDVLA